jgi:tetratricopeptide (TPR) repeat protein
MNYFELGIIEKRNGNVEKALEYFGLAIQVEGNGGAYLLRSQIYQSLGRYRDAINDLNVIIRNDPNFATAYLGRGMSYYFLGEEESNSEYLFKSAQDMNYAINLNPEMQNQVSVFREALKKRK